MSYEPVPCDLPTFDEPTLKALAVVALEMRQAIDECNLRNGVTDAN